jgi:hypothetical protein
VAAKEFGGGDARARRGGEENGDGCDEDRARASAFYRGRKEAEALGLLQWLAMKALVTCSEEGGGITTKLRRGHPLGSLYGVGERQCSARGGGGGAASSVREGGRGRGRGARPGGSTQPAWPLGAKRPDGPAGHRVKS